MFSGVVLLEMCHTLFKTLSLPMCVNITMPEVLERSKNYLTSVQRVFQHEDPNGPEAGGLLIGMKQMEAAIGQF